MEVLAIVAYNQPLTRSFVDQVRGVDSSYAMNSLIDKGLIEPCGRLDAPGRPMLYVTTEKFLRVFGINSLSELPATETLLPPKDDVPIVEDGDMTDEDSGTVTPEDAE
jgi:segregation and condensation protein B